MENGVHDIVMTISMLRSLVGSSFPFGNGPLRGHGFDMCMIFAIRPHVRGPAWVS